MPSSTIKIGVLGAGNFANNQHLPNLTKIDCAEVVAISDVNQDAAAATAQKFGIPRTYANGHEMLDCEQLDAMWSIIPAFARTDADSGGVTVAAIQPGGGPMMTPGSDAGRATLIRSIALSSEAIEDVVESSHPCHDVER